MNDRNSGVTGLNETRLEQDMPNLIVNITITKSIEWKGMLREEGQQYI